jgi:hypothetical protein
VAVAVRAPFWSFGAAFFGLTGLILHLVGGRLLALAAPFISGGVGVAAGLGASIAFRTLARDTIGQVRGAAALVGREGRCCCRSRARSGARCGWRSPAAVTSICSPSRTTTACIEAGADVLIVEFAATWRSSNAPRGAPRRS